MTRAGFEYVLEKHVRAPRQRCPSLEGRSVSPHQLRHSCAVLMLQATRDIRKVALWLGHADVRTTEVYLRMDPSEKLEAVEAVLPPGLRRGRFKAPDALIASLMADQRRTGLVRPVRRDAAFTVARAAGLPALPCARGRWPHLGVQLIGCGRRLICEGVSLSVRLTAARCRSASVSPRLCLEPPRRPPGCGLRPGLVPATASPTFFPAAAAAPRGTTSSAPAVLRCAAARGAGRPSRGS